MTDAKPRGRFVWYDLMTTDPVGAAAFYGRVTGWETAQWPGPIPYTMWMINGNALGGVTKLAPNDGGPHWLAYISTPDIDATVKDAVNIGARVIVPPTVIPTVGRYAVMADPHGSVFATFVADVHTPGHDGPAELREFSWHELATHDYPAAFRFYERLFGWQKTMAMEMGEAGTYQMFGRNGIEMGGMFNTSPSMPAPPGWLHYVRVDDVHCAIEAVKGGGGQVINGPIEVPGGDLIAQCLDPQGAMFALHGRKSG